jgi:DNA-directed RNA polymerase subunit M/transcription elongation factor TFIIS
MGKSDVRCPKCGKATNEVELIYPRTDEQDERRERAFICQSCLYVFGESDNENTNNSFRNEK